MITKQDRINEILELSKKQHINGLLIAKMTDICLSECERYNIICLLRSRMPANLVDAVVDNLSKFDNMQTIIKAYQSDEIDNALVYECVKNGNLERIMERFEVIKCQQDSFQYDLMNNCLFRNANVYNLLEQNNILYIKHEFNWNTYDSRLVLVGNNENIYFSMPQIPLIGGCWSNFVAQRMLMGQMYLQFIFDSAKSSLEFLCEMKNINCKIVACDNCFYAPYLYFYVDEKGKLVFRMKSGKKRIYKAIPIHLHIKNDNYYTESKKFDKSSTYCIYSFI